MIDEFGQLRQGGEGQEKRDSEFAKLWAKTPTLVCRWVAESLVELQREPCLVHVAGCILCASPTAREHLGTNKPILAGADLLAFVAPGCRHIVTDHINHGSLCRYRVVILAESPRVLEFAPQHIVWWDGQIVRLVQMRRVTGILETWLAIGTSMDVVSAQSAMP